MIALAILLVLLHYVEHTYGYILSAKNDSLIPIWKQLSDGSIQAAVFQEKEHPPIHLAGGTILAIYCWMLLMCNQSLGLWRTELGKKPNDRVEKTFTTKRKY